MERIGDAGPLLGLSAVCLVVGLDIRSAGGPILGGRLAVWGLFVALGVIAGIGGGVSYVLPESGAARAARKSGRISAAPTAVDEVVRRGRTSSADAPRFRSTPDSASIVDGISTGEDLGGRSPESIWDESFLHDPSAATAEVPEGDGVPPLGDDDPTLGSGPVVMQELDDLLAELDRVRAGRRRASPS